MLNHLPVIKTCKKINPLNNNIKKENALINKLEPVALVMTKKKPRPVTRNSIREISSACSYVYTAFPPL
jgi:hypothetical protein